MGLSRYLSKLAGLVGSDGKVPTAGIADLAVTAGKLHTTAVTDKLGYTPLNKAGDSMSGALRNVNAVTTKREIGGDAASGTTVTRVEEMINFTQGRNTSHYFKLRVGAYYSADDGQGALLKLIFGKMSVHASQNQFRVMHIALGGGTGSAPATYNIATYTEKDISIGWGYYGISFAFDVFYPSAGSSRDYLYIRVNAGDLAGSSQSPKSFIYLEGFATNINGSPLLVDLGESLPSDFSNFSLASPGSW